MVRTLQKQDQENERKFAPAVRCRHCQRPMPPHDMKCDCGGIVEPVPIQSNPFAWSHGPRM